MLDNKLARPRKRTSLPTRLALSTALATVAFAYGGRAAYAGACLPNGPPGTYLCSVGADPFKVDLNQNISGAPLTVTTTSGFGIDTSYRGGYALKLEGLGGGLSFTDGNSSAITGATRGIQSQGLGAGTMTLTTTGQLTGKSSDGMLAQKLGAGDLTISTAGVSGFSNGVVAFAENGVLNVSSTGTVTGTSFSGISATNNNGGDLTVSAADVSGRSTGIKTQHYGSGSTSITATGTVTVTGPAGDGIFARNGNTANPDGTDMTVLAANVTGTDDGIDVRNYGSGAVNIITTGTVRGTGNNGIYVNNKGAGLTSVTVSGLVQGGPGVYPATGSGISTVTGAGKSSIITLNAGGVVGNYYGDAISNDAGNSTTTINSGAQVFGKFSMGGGSDSVTFNGGDFTLVSQIDGGAGVDALTFRNANGGFNAANILNVENVTIGSGATMSFLNNPLNADLTIASGGRLTVTTVNGDVTVEAGGTLAPGTSPGLTSIIGNLDLGLGSITNLELGGLTAITQYDRLDVSDDPGTGGTLEGIATLTAGAIFDIDFFGAFTAGLGDVFDVLVADTISVTDFGTLVFDFTNAALGSGFAWDASIVTFDGTREALRLTVVEEQVAQLPEPSAMALFATNLLGIFGLGRARGQTWWRRRSAS
jgi:hypothetical protein